MLVLRRIHITYHLRLRPDQREAAERAHEVHHDSCPVYRSIKHSVQMTTSLEMEDLSDEPGS